MCDCPRRMSLRGTPTECIREWSGLTHSVMELAGPEPFGEDGHVQLWLHQDSLTRLYDMCDVIDDRFSMLEKENERLRELVRDMHEEMRMVSEIWAEDVCADRLLELGIEVD